MFEEMQKFFAQYANNSVISISKLIEETSNILSDNFFFNGEGDPKALWLLVNNLAGILKPTCYIIMIIAMLYELINTAVKLDQIKWEYAVKTLIKIVIAKVAIDEGTKVLTCIYLTSVEWVTSFGELETDSLSLLEWILSFCFKAEMNNVTEWESLAMMTTVSIVILMIKFCEILVKVMAYARMFELCVLVVLAPIPFAFLPLTNSGSVSRITIRYIKNYAAVSLQAVVIMVVLRVYQTLFLLDFVTELLGIIGDRTIGSSEKVLGMCFLMILSTGILIISIIKSGNWAKQIMDAA